MKEEESVQLCVLDVHLTFPSLNSSGRKEFRVTWLRHAWTSACLWDPLSQMLFMRIKSQVPPLVITSRAPAYSVVGQGPGDWQLRERKKKPKVKALWGAPPPSLWLKAVTVLHVSDSLLFREKSVL